MSALVIHEAQPLLRASYALVALVLIRLEARIGEWEPMQALAGHIDVELETLDAHCEFLASQHEIEVQRDAETGRITHARMPPRFKGAMA